MTLLVEIRFRFRKEKDQVRGWDEHAIAPDLCHPFSGRRFR